MASLEGLVASLQGPLIMEQLKKAQAGGAATPPIVEQPSTKPMSVEELLKDYLGKKGLTPTAPYKDMAQSYAPHGNQLNFTGGSPFPVDETPAVLNNGLVMAQELTKIIGDLRKKKAERDAAAKASKPAAGGK